MIFYDHSVSPLKSPHLITCNSDNSVVEYYFQDHITSLRTGWDNIVEADYQTLLWAPHSCDDDWQITVTLI